MARMIPYTCPPQTLSTAEYCLFDEFRHRLGSDYTVIHSLPWLTEKEGVLREGECDFLILHPAKGLLAVEVKGAGARYERDLGEWIRDDGVVIKDPFRQAEKAAHRFNGILREKIPEWAKLQPTYGYAVAFPDASKIKGDLLPHMKPEIIILEPDVEHLEKAVDRAFRHWGEMRTAIGPDLMRRVIDVLLPECYVVPSLKASLKEEERLLIRLTNDQIRIIDAMNENPRLLVKGCAGSGKTILAREKACQLANDGREVLFLCFNKSLAATLHGELGDAKPGVQISTFHGLCRDVLGEQYKEPRDPKERKRFYDQTVAEMLSDAIGSDTKRYDAIVVDEGQDFQDTWWVPLDDLLKGDKKYYIFLDPEQNLYKRPVSLPFDSPVARLPVNCRNTKAIGRWMAENLNVPVRTDDDRLPEGKKPHVTGVKDDAAEVDEVRKVLHYLIHEEKLETGQIVILGRHKLQNSPFAGTRTLGNYRVVEMGRETGPADVRYSTIHSFKGLEADCVLLTEVGRPSEHVDEEVERVLTYVGASRAKHLLYVFRRA